MKAMRRIISLLLIITMIGASFTGCSKKDTRPVVVVQALSTSEDMLRCIEEQCPDINIKWYLSSQVHENAYEGMTDTPDILLRQAYYLDENGSSYLKDISEFEVTANYSKNLIDSFKDENGALYWLPIQGTALIFVANKQLFEENGIAYPTDYASLLAADRAFKELGIDGVRWPMSESYAYSALRLAMILGADLLNSVAGTSWRNSYVSASKNGTDYTLDDEIWPEMFRRFEQAIADGLIDETDMETSDAMAIEAMSAGTCAMTIMNTANLNTLPNEVEIIPIFDMNGTEWLPIYMNLRVGISANVTDERMDDVLKVFKAYISTAAFNAYYESRGGVIPMNNDISALPENMSALKDVIESGYTFLQTQDQNGGIIDGLNAAIHTMFDEKLDAGAAYTVAKEKVLENRKTDETAGLNDDDPDAVFFTSTAAYSNITDENHNNPAGSAIANTLLDIYNAYGEEQYDILLMEGNLAGAPIRAISYYADANDSVSDFSSNFHYLMNGARQVYAATMTVEELIQYINTSYYYFHRIDDGLATMAGASYKVDKYPDGLSADELPFTPNSANKGKVSNVDNYPVCYVCTAIVKDGKELPLDTTLRVLVGRVEMFYITDQDSSYSSGWKGFDMQVKILDEEGNSISHKDLLRKWFMEGHQFTAPTQYVTITEVEQ